MHEEQPLFQLHSQVDARVRAIREDRPEWLCAKGCAACCRQLAQVPQLTAAEWSLLQEGLAALAPQRLADIRRDIATLAGQRAPPVVCPLLDAATNACLVYAQRPVACRSYGFYAQRDLGLYCHDIESMVAGGALADVVWGNHDAIDHQLGALGEVRALTDWFAGWDAGR